MSLNPGIINIERLLMRHTVYKMVRNASGVCSNSIFSCVAVLCCVVFWRPHAVGSICNAQHDPVYQPQATDSAHLRESQQPAVWTGQYTLSAQPAQYLRVIFTMTHSSSAYSGSMRDCKASIDKVEMSASQSMQLPIKRRGQCYDDDPPGNWE